MIELQKFQQDLNAFLSKKLVGEIQNGALERRAQRLADKFFKDRTTPVAIGKSGLFIVGCTLAFDIGRIMVSQWHTRFQRDEHAIHLKVPGAIALGWINQNQIYIAKHEGLWTLHARAGDHLVERWNNKQPLIPGTDTVLFVALQRATQLGYLELLKNENPV